ncbi:hypothetical protein B0H14DRAFT_2598137 [Mycena olivaceomarginata]|nr:hypothetical protein B0H14DRAFT_2598137 [Mycena olivaceomarginata]
MHEVTSRRAKGGRIHTGPHPLWPVLGCNQHGGVGMRTCLCHAKTLSWAGEGDDNREQRARHVGGSAIGNIGAWMWTATCSCCMLCRRRVSYSIAVEIRTHTRKHKEEDKGEWNVSVFVWPLFFGSAPLRWGARAVEGWELCDDMKWGCASGEGESSSSMLAQGLTQCPATHIPPPLCALGPALLSPRRQCIDLTASSTKVARCASLSSPEVVRGAARAASLRVWNWSGTNLDSAYGINTPTVAFDTSDPSI